MRKFWGISLVAVAALCLMGLTTACGDAEANPTRWNLDKVALPDEVTEVASQEAGHKVELDFYAKDSGEVAFTRTYELAVNQKEIVVSEVPADGEYTVKGYLYEDGKKDVVCDFEAELESF